MTTTSFVPTIHHLNFPAPVGRLAVRRVIGCRYPDGRLSGFGWGESLPVWEVVHNYTTRTVATAREAAKTLRRVVADARKAAGDKGAAEVWEALCEQQAAIARERRTAADLLRDPAGRVACRKAAEAGKKYSAAAEQLARRPVVRQAVALLAERLARREAAKRLAPESGKFARLALERRVARTKAAVKDAARGNYRVSQTRWAGGHTTTVLVGETRWVSAARDGSAVGAVGGSNKVWSENGKWSGNESAHVFQVRLDWLEAVHARGLACVDGLLTLDARPVLGVGPELYQAVWVEQGRGTSLNTVRGYIARDPATGRTYHAPTARAALDGLARKLGQKPARRKGTVDLDRLVRRHGNLPVYFSDREGIACEAGTRSWCHAVGIDPDTGCTVADVVAGYKLRPMPEALQIIRRVVRSGRQPGAPDPDATLPESSLEAPTGRVVFDSEGGFYIEPSDN